MRSRTPYGRRRSAKSSSLEMARMRSKDVWYFAYGSNLNVAQLMTRIGKWKAARKAVLKNHKLTFDICSPSWGGGVADIVESEGNSVKGAIYRISKEQLYVLDTYEGYNGKGRQNFYERNEPECPMPVISQGRKVGVVTYWVANKSAKIEFIKPTNKYMETLVEGLRQHGWDEKVVQEVEAIAKSRGERI